MRQLRGVGKAGALVAHEVSVSVGVVSRLLETEVEEFEKRAEVLGSSATRDVLHVVAERNRSAYLLTRELLLKFYSGKVAKTCAVHDFAEDACVLNVLILHK